MTYKTVAVPVRGGDLTVGQWGADEAPVILAIHGITASHRAWSVLARHLPDYRIVAPDLRGRGRSSTLPAPYGMKQHAEDVDAVVTHLGLARPMVVGHSMGAFVGAVYASTRHEQVRSLLLVDGGLPLGLPPGVDQQMAVAATLGVVAKRLSMTFPDRAAVRDLWRVHPAFVGQWSEELAQYADYDAIEVDGGYRSSVPIAVVAGDSPELFGSETVLESLRHLPPGTELLTAPRGLADETPGLYTPAQISEWRKKMPDLLIEEVADVNHYTIVMNEKGAAAVASKIEASARAYA